MTSSKSLTRILVLLPLALLWASSAGAVCIVTYGDSDANGSPDLFIRGTTGHQNLILDLYQTETVVSLDCDGIGGFNQPLKGDLDHVHFGPAELIHLFLIDNVTIHFAGDLVGQRRIVEVQGGGAKSTYTVGSTPSPDGTLPGAPDPGKLLANSTFSIQVRGKNGPDYFNFTMPSVVDNSAINVRAELGDGNDHLNLVSGGVLSGGSVAEFELDGDGYANAYLLDQSGIIDNSTLKVKMEGGPSIDLATVKLAGQILAGGRLLVRSDLGDGNDKFTGNLDLGNFSIAAGGEARFHINGGPATDVMSFTTNGTTAGPLNVMAGVLDLVFQGGPGSDQINLDLGTGFSKTDGTLRIRADGEAGNDTINVAATIQPASTTPNADVILWGGAGLDHLSLTWNDGGPGTPANYGPAQTILVDGGTYAQDVCTVAGTIAPSFVHKRNCEF